MNQKKTLVVAGIAGAAVIAAAIIYQLAKPTVEYTLAAGERPYAGRADAAVVVDEYGDFQCPACRSAVPFVKKYIDLYGANVRFNFKHFPLETIHANALQASMAAECANDQGKFWEMHDIIYDRQSDGLSKGNLRVFAKEVGVSESEYNACMDTKARLNIVRKDQAEGLALKISGTPSFAVNGKVVSLRDLEAAIRQELGLPPVSETTEN